MNDEYRILKDLWVEPIIESLNRAPHFLGEIPPPPPLTRLQRIGRGFRRRFMGSRERLALLLAPWLEGDEDW